MPLEVSDDRVVIRLDLDEPFELSDVSAGFAALSRQYERVLAEHDIDPKDIKSKLMVTDLKSGRR